MSVWHNELTVVLTGLSIPVSMSGTSAPAPKLWPITQMAFEFRGQVIANSGQRC
jgi:hypothetical protein